MHSPIESLSQRIPSLQKGLSPQAEFVATVSWLGNCDAIFRVATNPATNPNWKGFQSSGLRLPQWRQYASGRGCPGPCNHHFVVDGPAQNGCPGEAITPAEHFLAGVATCGVELVQVLAKSEGIPVSGIAVDRHRGRSLAANPRGVAH
jgi:hypothetical protein